MFSCRVMTDQTQSRWAGQYRNILLNCSFVCGGGGRLLSAFLTSFVRFSQDQFQRVWDRIICVLTYYLPSFYSSSFSSQTYYIIVIVSVRVLSPLKNWSLCEVEVFSYIFFLFVRVVRKKFIGGQLQHIKRISVYVQQFLNRPFVGKVFKK